MMKTLRITLDIQDIPDNQNLEEAYNDLFKLLDTKYEHACWTAMQIIKNDKIIESEYA